MRIWGFPRWAIATVLLLTAGAVASHIWNREPHILPPLPPAEAQTAQDRLAQTTLPPGFQPLRSDCTSGYVCFGASAGGPMTAGSYEALADAFGVTLSTERCDHMMTAASGRAVQICDGYGDFQRWGVAATLTVTRDGDGSSQTKISFAPVRRG